MPATGDVLLDTSVVVRYFRKDAAIHQQLQNFANLCLPLTALGELHCGAHLSANPTKTLAEIGSFLAAVTLLPTTIATAERYGRIRAALARAGTPIPENDIWIAAIAQEHGLPLAAHDQHFNQIAGLQVFQW